MKPTVKFKIVFMSILMVLPLSQKSVRGGSKPHDTLSQTFYGAYSNQNGVKFDAPKQIEWKELAPSKYRDIDIKHPTPEFLASVRERLDMFSNAKFDFYNSIPPDLVNSYFYLISPDGIQPIILDKLHGVARFSSFNNGSSIDNVVYYGDIFAVLQKSGTTKGGFVIQLKKPTNFKVENVTIDPLEFGKIEPKQNPHERTAQSFWEIIESFSFYLGDHLAFVQWVGDSHCREGCCQFRFSILNLDTKREIASNYYGCDI